FPLPEVGKRIEAGSPQFVVQSGLVDERVAPIVHAIAKVRVPCSKRTTHSEIDGDRVVTVAGCRLNVSCDRSRSVRSDSPERVVTSEYLVPHPLVFNPLSVGVCEDTNTTV